MFGYQVVQFEPALVSSLADPSGAAASVVQR
jgi:hypothetical protein